MYAATTGDWQLQQCPDLGCSAATLRVRRDPRNRELWWVGRLEHEGTWQIAATEPCCPLCGSSLEMVSQYRERAG